MSLTRPARCYSAPEWTAAENAAVTRLYATGSQAELKDALPGRSWNAICLYANGTLNLKRYGYWNPQRLRVLRRHYPTKGGRYVADRLGCAITKVNKQASLQGLLRVLAPKPTPIPKAPKPVKPTPQPKPKPQPKPVVEAVAQHQPARLSNLINQKAQKKKKEKKLVHKSLTVEEFKQLPQDHPGRMYYLRDGARGWDKWVQSQQAA